MQTQLSSPYRHYNDLQHLLENQGIHLCYNGILTEAILTSLGSSLRHKLELEGIHWKVRRGIFSALVEQVQNVIRYSARVRQAGLVTEIETPMSNETSGGEDESDVQTLRFGFLAVGTREDGIHFVTCSNVVSNSDVQRLQGLLDDICYLDREALMVRMKETLKSETPPGSKGAGIGLLTIAREASKGIRYGFSPFEDDLNGQQHSHFTITANF